GTFQPERSHVVTRPTNPAVKTWTANWIHFHWAASSPLKRCKYLTKPASAAIPNAHEKPMMFCAASLVSLSIHHSHAVAYPCSCKMGNCSSKRLPISVRYPTLLGISTDSQ